MSELLSEEEIKTIFLEYYTKQYGESAAEDLLERLPDCNYGKAIAQAQIDKLHRPREGLRERLVKWVTETFGVRLKAPIYADQILALLPDEQEIRKEERDAVYKILDDFESMFTKDFMLKYTRISHNPHSMKLSDVVRQSLSQEGG